MATTSSATLLRAAEHLDRGLRSEEAERNRFLLEGQSMGNNLRFRVGLAMLALFGLGLICTGIDGRPAREAKKDVVYVCACLKNKSCSCMTMAASGGFCACGPEGGPSLKAVPRDSEWAKQNRDALAQ
jgi:hypothetical protein